MRNATGMALAVWATACFGEAPVTGSGSGDGQSTSAGTTTSTDASTGGSEASSAGSANPSTSSDPSAETTIADSSGSSGGVDCEPALDGLVAWWPFENDATDRVAGLTLDLLDVSFDEGRHGLAARFDGLAAIGTAPSNGALEVASGDFTVEAWVNLDDLVQPPGFGAPVDFAVVTKMLSSPGMPNADGWRLLMFAGDHRWWFCLGGDDNGCNPGGNTANVARSSSEAVAATWIHVVGVRTGNGVRIYVDGVLEDDLQATAPIINVDMETPLTIGGTAFTDGEGRSFALFGRVDEVSIYARALSDDQIAGLAQAARPRCGS